MTDHQSLLAEYVQTGSDSAFRELVSRYVDLVYSTALRLVGADTHCAEDVAQTVFADLARLAKTLPADVKLGGWLHRDTCFVAANLMRGERRRKSRERQATEMNALQNHSETDYSLVAPILDEAINELGEADRTAILLRFFEQQDFRAVGQALGSNEDAARMRVIRALEKLEHYLKRRGITTTAATLGVVLAANAVQAAPVGLAVTISTAAALEGTTLASATTTTAIKTIAMTTTKKALTTLALLAFLSIATYEIFHTKKSGIQSVQAGSVLETTTVTPGSGATQPGPAILRPGRDKQAASTDVVNLAADLNAELHYITSSKLGTHSYPPSNVMRALLAFGTNRKKAFATLQEALNDPELEVRLRAISAMGFVGAISTPRNSQFVGVGDPAPEAKPLLWKVLQKGDAELAPLALSSLRTIGFEAIEIPDLTDLMSRTTNNQLRRYLPEAIAKAIQTDPAGAAPFIANIESMLSHTDTGIQFEAACALARSEAARNPQILETLLAGLKGTGNLQQLMALETFQGLGSAADPALQAILDYGDATTDEVMKAVAYKTIGMINGETRSGLPEVDEALKKQENIASWNEKFVSGNYTRQDLMEALKEPMVSVTAATKLGELGSNAQEAVPDLIAALAGQDQSARDRIVEAIHQIDPQTAIAKVEFKNIAAASLTAFLALEASSGQRPQTPLTALLENSMKGNSEWQTQQEVVKLAKAIAAENQQVYSAFADKLLEVEPNLVRFIPVPAAR